MAQAEPRFRHAEHFAENLDDRLVGLAISGLRCHAELDCRVGDVSYAFSSLVGAWFHVELDLQMAQG